MARRVTFDELVVTVRVPADLSEPQTETVRRALQSEEFMDRLRRAVRAAVQAEPALNVVRVRVGR